MRGGLTGLAGGAWLAARGVLLGADGSTARLEASPSMLADMGGAAAAGNVLHCAKLVLEWKGLPCAHALACWPRAAGYRGMHASPPVT